MLKISRLKNLKNIKDKKMNKVSLEINTLSNELEKSNDLKKKLTLIKKNSIKENKYQNSWGLKHKYEFDFKIFQQLSICTNRENFLNKELRLAKDKLGKLILQKKHIDNKIKFLNYENLKIKEEKLIKDTPTFRKA